MHARYSLPLCAGIALALSQPPSAPLDRSLRHRTALDPWVVAGDGEQPSFETLSRAASAMRARPATDGFFVFDIVNFGAKGDGTSNDAPAIQAAANAAVAAGGGTIFLPSTARGYNILSTINITSAIPLQLVGEGWSSILLWPFDGDLIVWGPNSTSDQPAHLLLADFAIVCVGAAPKSRRSTALRFPNGIVRSTIHSLLFYGRGAVPGMGAVTACACGTNLDLGTITDTVTVRDVLHWFVGGTGVVIGRGSEVRIMGGRIIGPSVRNDSSVGVHVTGNNGGVHISETDVIGLQTGVLLNDASGAGSNREIFITHATMDSDGVGLLVNDSSYVSIAGVWAASCDVANVMLAERAGGAHVVISGGTIFNAGVLASNGTCAPGRASSGCVGLEIRAGSVSLSGVLIWANQGVGMYVHAAAAPGVSASGCKFEQNGQGLFIDGAASSYGVTGGVFVRNEMRSDFGGMAGGAVVANNVLAGVDAVASAAAAADVVYDGQ